MVRHELFMKPCERLVVRRNIGGRARGFAQTWLCDLLQQL